MSFISSAASPATFNACTAASTPGRIPDGPAASAGGKPVNAFRRILLPGRGHAARGCAVLASGAATSLRNVHL